MKNINVGIYLVTDNKILKGITLEKAVEEAILGGATIVQLREKDASSLEFYEKAVRVKNITDKYNIPLIINDRIDIALAINAAGVHLGQSDIPCEIARKILGDNKIIGVSAHNLQEALKAVNDGADYLGCGAVFSTGTKKDVTNLKIEELVKIRNNINVPIVAIGGITSENIGRLYKTGIDGVAVVSAILGKKDIKKATLELKEKIKEL